MIEARSLTKRYGSALAVDDLTFRVEPGRVTGFLGPNGAGKSTTMRILLGLDHQTSGVALINGRPHRDSPAPLRTTGALLDARDVNKGRSGRAHLRALADSNGLPRRRVDTVLDIVGLRTAGTKRIKTYSLGMLQRLGIAAALLGEPGVLLFDEPLNGLDPEGIVWIRAFLRTLADEGRTILISSHLMNEMAVTADHLLIIGRGKLLADVGTKDFLETGRQATVRVRASRLDKLGTALAGRDVRVTEDGDSLIVAGATAQEVGEQAFRAGVVIHELHQERASLESAFMEMTRDSADFQTSVDAA